MGIVSGPVMEPVLLASRFFPDTSIWVGHDHSGERITPRSNGIYINIYELSLFRWVIEFSSRGGGISGSTTISMNGLTVEDYWGDEPPADAVTMIKELGLNARIFE